MGIRTKKEEVKAKSVYREYISVNDFKARKKAWDDYYVKVPTTRAYELFKTQVVAFKKNDMSTVQELAKKANQNRIDGNWELTKPPYPDPEIERRYKRLGVYEWDTETDIVKAAEEIFNG